MNAGNMGFPLALFAFGQAGMQRATLMFVMLTLLQYSLGIYILNGRGNWTEIFRLPLIYAAIMGISINLAQLRIPELLLQPITMLGQATIPIMLISLGYRLHAVESLQLGHALGGALLRIFGGSAAANIAVNLIGAEGVNRQVLLLIRRTSGCGRQLFSHRKVSARPWARRVHRGDQHVYFSADNSNRVLVDPLIPILSLVELAESTKISTNS